MLISEAFPSKYLSAPDLRGQAVTATIAHLMSEKMDDGVAKPVMSFVGAKKTLILNITNAKTIAKLYGDNTEGWIGKQIEIFPALTEFKGETVDCIRVRGPVLPAVAAQAPLNHPATIQASPMGQPLTAQAPLGQAAATQAVTAPPSTAPAAPPPVPPAAPAPADVAGLDPDDPIPF